MVVGLPRAIAERELRAVRYALAWTDAELEVVEHQKSGPGQGNVVLLRSDHEHATELVTSIGERGTPAEVVAGRAVDELHAYLAHDAPVGAHLADQLLLPLAIGAGGSYVTGPLSLHARTNIEVIRAFLDVSIEAQELSGRCVKVTVG